MKPIDGLAAGAEKHFTAGTHRCVAPELTLERVQPFMPLMGITRIANITGLDAIGLPVVMVCRPNARSLSVSQGKGLTLAAAKASGLMESVEFWHAERIRKPLLLGSLLELKYDHRLVNVDRMPRLTVSVFDEHQRILWIEGRDLVSGESVWVPYESVHTDYRLPLPAGSGCFPMNSNGLASGNHLLEAATHAVCELIERDASALWHAGGSAARTKVRVDLDTVADPSARRLLDDYARAGILVALWEITTDIGVPVVACEILDDEVHRDRKLGPSAGIGCHPSADIALVRALTEAAQSRLTRIASSRDDVPRIDYEITRNADVLEPLRAEYRYMPANREFPAASGLQSTSFEEDLNWLVERLRRSGMEEVVLVDLTDPRLDIPVVRAIVPGLETPHEAPGYQPGVRAQAVLAARR